MISIAIAEPHYLILEGLKSITSSIDLFHLCGIATDKVQLDELLRFHKPKVLIMDYACDSFSIEDIKWVKKISPKTTILALTHHISQSTINLALKSGVCSHVLKDCGKEEIIDAIKATSENQSFFCSKVLDTLGANEGEAKKDSTAFSSAVCDGLNISEREIEIIRLIAEGFSNKEIADKLFLSTHTVNTHRKNIMNKLGVNNTAGIVLFAVKENIISPNKFLFSAG
ncbi:MAG: response regulator transcription factor [Bacteroidia bacterium]